MREREGVRDIERESARANVYVRGCDSVCV